MKRGGGWRGEDDIEGEMCRNGYMVSQSPQKKTTPACTRCLLILASHVLEWCRVTRTALSADFVSMCFIHRVPLWLWEEGGVLLGSWGFLAQ